MAVASVEDVAAVAASAVAAASVEVAAEAVASAVAAVPVEDAGKGESNPFGTVLFEYSEYSDHSEQQSLIAT